MTVADLVVRSYVMVDLYRKAVIVLWFGVQTDKVPSDILIVWRRHQIDIPLGHGADAILGDNVARERVSDKPALPIWTCRIGIIELNEISTVVLQSGEIPTPEIRGR
jgi:hypothetical protein